MKNVLRIIKIKLRNFTQWKPKYSELDNLLRIGTTYGGWTIPTNLLSEKSICYLAGAGEDISFDVGLVEKFRCQVYIFDSTPRAKIHFELLIESVKKNIKMSINNSKTDFYDLHSMNVGLLNFREIGLWN